MTNMKMKTVELMLEGFSWSRFHSILVRKFLEDHDAKHIQISRGDFYDFLTCVVVCVDEETLFKIKLKYGSLYDGVNSYNMGERSAIWKEYVHSLGESSPLDESTESDDV